ncbi:MAG: copper resistance protein CopC [Bowdeniella nasicola]|nr:copper resistance protein CopC [Bowdeniella nasicola]
MTSSVRLGRTFSTGQLIAWLCGAALVFASFAAALPARAHDVLVSSSPEDGATLSNPPAEIVLTFNNELLDLGEGAAAVAITDTAKNQVAGGPLHIEGRDARFPVPELPDGAYRAAWSVVSSDGHRIQGVISYTVSGGGQASPANPGSEAGASDADRGTDSETSGPEGDATACESPGPCDSDDAAAAHNSDDGAESAGGFTLPTAVYPIIGIAIIATIIMIILKLKRTQP